MPGPLGPPPVMPKPVPPLTGPIAQPRPRGAMNFATPTRGEYFAPPIHPGVVRYDGPEANSLFDPPGTPPPVQWAGELAKPGVPPVQPGTLKQSNQRTERTVTPEDQVMIEKVAAPAFFAKIAADTGVTPHDAETADQLRLLGDRVVAGVEAYRTKLAAAQAAQTNRLVKVAAEAVGLVTPQPAQPAAPDFLADGEVYAAAAGLLAKAAAVKEPELPITAPKPAETPAA